MARVGHGLVGRSLFDQLSNLDVLRPDGMGCTVESIPRGDSCPRHVQLGTCSRVGIRQECVRGQVRKRRRADGGGSTVAARRMQGQEVRARIPPLQDCTKARNKVRWDREAL